MTDTPITPTTQTTGATPPAQDLQINLEEVTEQSEGIPQGGTPKTEIQPETGNLEPETNLDLDLNLDLNLPEVEKTDDRLKAEDEKNQQVETPTEEPTPTTEENISTTKDIAKESTTPVVENVFEENPFVPEVEMPKIPSEELFMETQPETPVQEMEPSSSIEEVASISTEPTTKSIIEPTTLQEDMNIINELQAQASEGGLAEEAKMDTTPEPITETPKTFDLDAMLGTQTSVTQSTEVLLDKGGNEGGFEAIAKETPPTIEQKAEVQQTVEQPTIPQMVAPAFTIPTTEQSVSSSAIIGNNLPTSSAPHKKTTGVKTLLFVMLFVALGFTTYFILQTMYPVEFGNIFNKNTSQQIHGIAEEEIEEIEELEELEIIEELPSIDNFGELNDFIAPIEEETDISRLADYVNKGNELREIGKTMNNNTIIKFSLYIKTKATSFLENIAKEEEIPKLDSYFAQFDQYIEQLEALIETNDIPPNETEVSSPTPTDSNAFEENTNEAEPMTNEF